MRPSPSAPRSPQQLHGHGCRVPGTHTCAHMHAHAHAHARARAHTHSHTHILTRTRTHTHAHTHTHTHARSGFTDLAITYQTPRGDDLDTRLLRANVLKGVLEGTTTAMVNLVNADLLAKNRGIKWVGRARGVGVCGCVRVRLCAPMCVCVRVCVCVRERESECVSACVCMCTRAFACMFVCVHAHAHMCAPVEGKEGGTARTEAPLQCIGGVCAPCGRKGEGGGQRLSLPLWRLPAAAKGRCSNSTLKWVCSQTSKQGRLQCTLWP